MATVTSRSGTVIEDITAAATWRAARRRELRAMVTGLLFISPWLIGALAFQVYPFFASLYYSFRTTTALNNGRYIGLANYRDLIHDALFWKSLYNTFSYVGCVLLIGTVCSLGLAMLLSQRIRGMTVYRTIVGRETIVSLVAVSVIWIWILHPQYGIANYITRGGPADSTLTYALYLYNNAFQFSKMGYASAMAWILFLIILAVTAVLLRSSSRWVFYQGGGR